MAKLSAHGEELLRLEFTTYRLAYMSDGQALRNVGDGWKKYKKVKDGLNIREVVQDRGQKRLNFRNECPCWARYLDLLVDNFSLEHRAAVHTIIDMMPQDPDGCWSEINDNMGEDSIDLETLVEMCRAWQSAEKEIEEYKVRHKIPEKK